MSNGKLQVTLLADEWKSSKGGLSTINRELAIQLAKHPNVSVTFLVPKCSKEDEDASGSCNVGIVKVKERHGYDPVDWLSFPPKDHPIDIIIGHGVKLGRQAQVITESHQCKWVQVVHTAPEELALMKTYSDCDNAISKGDKKQWDEIKLCQIADLVVAVGPRLWEFYSRYLASSERHVFNLTPGIFSELSSLKHLSVEGKRFHILLFGRGDSEDFKLKGYDIAAKAIAELNDKSYHLTFLGALSGDEGKMAKKLLEYGLSKKQLIVKTSLENRDDLATLLSGADLAIIPSRSEGFGLTALEALSAGLPFLVTQSSGFGEALQDILPQGTPWIVDSEESDKWAEAIKDVRKMGRKAAILECQTLRECYGMKYSWEDQCSKLLEIMVSLTKAPEVVVGPSVTAAPLQDGNVAFDETSGKEVGKEQSDTSSKPEQCEKLLENGPENLLGVIRVHLFNCEDAGKLEPVEKLLEKFSSHVKCVEKHSFRLAQMSEMVDQIPTLDMDMAFFVVHAHQSPLLINEDNAGIGYAKIYRALLRATGEDVIIVIGGDDSYKDDEENREVISRWAKRKVASQLGDEYLDGRKSFIFSWNKQHREIHEHALLHHFDPNKKGKQFEYQPPQRKEPPKAATPPSARSKEATPWFRICHSESRETHKADTKQKEKPNSFLYRKEAVIGTSQVKDEKTFTHPLVCTTYSNSIWRNQENPATTSKQGAGSERFFHQRIGTIKDLAVLGCNVSHESMRDVEEVLKKVLPILNLSEVTIVPNLQITEVKEFLRANRFRFSMLAVEGRTVTCGYDSQELLRLVEASVERVVEKVIILVCNLPSTSAKSGNNQLIGRINEMEKTFLMEVNNGNLAVEADVFLQLFSPPRVSSMPNAQFISQEQYGNAESLSTISSHSNENYLQRNSSEGKSGVEKGAPNYQQLVRASQFNAESPPVVLLRSFVRRGQISYGINDLQVWEPEFIVPYDIQKSLSVTYADSPPIGVRIIKFSNGTIQWFADPNLKQFKPDRETSSQPDRRLVLKTRVIQGKVSFEDEDVQYRIMYIPKNVIDDIQRKKANGDLYIVLYDSNEFEFVVKTSGILGQATTAVKSTGRAIGAAVAKKSRSLFSKEYENC